MTCSMLARVRRAIMAEEPRPRAKAGIMICVPDWPQPATGSHFSVRAKRKISTGPSTTLGTDTPKMATPIER